MSYSNKISFKKEYTNLEGEKFTIQAYNLKAKHITLLNKKLVPAVTSFLTVYTTGGDNEFKSLNAVDQLFEVIDAETLEELQYLLLGSVVGFDNDPLKTEDRIDEFFDEVGVELVQSVLIDLGTHAAKKLVPVSMSQKAQEMFKNLMPA